MNLEKVVFGFFVLLAATLNFGFFIGDIANPEVHNIYELFAALAVSLIATVLKFGDRTQIGAVHLATSLVADLQLPMARPRWPQTMSSCLPARVPSGANSRAQWWSTRPEPTCCSVCTFRPAGCGASCPERIARRAPLTTAEA